MLFPPCLVSTPKHVDRTAAHKRHHAYLLLHAMSNMHWIQRDAFLSLQSGAHHGFSRNINDKVHECGQSPEQVVVHHDSCFDYGLLVLYLFQRVARQAPISTSVFEFFCILPYIRLLISFKVYESDPTTSDLYQDALTSTARAVPVWNAYLTPRYEPAEIVFLCRILRNCPAFL